MRYPIYVPSRGRPDRCLTAGVLDGIDFRLVVEPHEQDIYAAVHGPDRLLVLPESHRGITYARNWIKDHAIAEGHERHWQADDNIRSVRYWEGGTRTIRHPADALNLQELFIDRYTNIAISGMISTAFGHEIRKPFSPNKQVYCFVCVRSDEYRWRGPGGWEDTDYSLQVLTGGDCTIQFNMWQIEKAKSSSMEGGNTDMYEAEDGRLARAKGLQQMWPGLVKIERKWGRPQQNLAQVWRKFDTPLIRKAEADV